MPVDRARKALGGEANSGRNGAGQEKRRLIDPIVWLEVGLTLSAPCRACRTGVGVGHRARAGRDRDRPDPRS